MRTVWGALLAASLAPSAVGAEAPARVSVPGATLRLVLASPDAAGRVDGVLAIDLEPGWKTYWIDPGPVGLAPLLDFSGSSGLSSPETDYPTPVRFREGEAQSVGYDAPVLLPFRATRTGDGPVRARLALRIGLCRELCVPVTETLATDPSPSLSVRAEVLAARRALPEPGSRSRVELRFDGARLHAFVPADPSDDQPDVFPMGLAPWRIDQPTQPAVRRADGWDFAFPARLDNAASASTLPPVDLVVTTANAAEMLHGVEVVRSESPSAAPPSSETPR